LRLTGVVVSAAFLCAGAGKAAPPGDRQSGHEVLVFLRMGPDHARPGDTGGGDYAGAGAAARERIAKRLAAANGLNLVEDWPMASLGFDCYVMSAPLDRPIAAVAAQLARDPRVAWSQPLHLYHGDAAPTGRGDPLLAAQPATRFWRLPALHELSTGRGVRVAVIDSKVDARHPDLLGQVVIDRDFVEPRAMAPEAHGTAVAGVIAAKAGNGLGIAGVAPDARVMALRACWQAAAGTVCDSLSLAKALYFAIDHGAGVINLSLAGPADLLLARLIDLAGARGVAVVASYDRELPGGGFPASEPGVVAVSDKPVDRPGPLVYSAPGRDVPTTEPGGGWGMVDGSSFAAAHVSGLIALIRQTRRAQAGLDLIAHRGVIDACASLLQAAGPRECACAHAPQTNLARR
jgi:hypothetical protein